VYDASTTIIVPFTTTLTSTSTTTTTSATTITPTVTYTPPEATFYAACSPQNLLSPPANYGVNSERYNPPSVQSTVGAATSYDCCVACITNPFCKVAQFNTFGTGCVLDFGGSSTTCAGGLSIDVGFQSPPFGETSVLSVGNCGGTFGFSY
jgi:hypothetical protein